MFTFFIQFLLKQVHTVVKFHNFYQYRTKRRLQRLYLYDHGRLSYSFKTASV